MFFMTAQVIQIRDYQNRKDIERLYAELKPFTETESFTDTAPCEMSPHQSHNDAILDRLHGIPANVERNGSVVGAPINVPYGGQGIDGMVFTAPDKDPA